MIWLFCVLGVGCSRSQQTSAKVDPLRLQVEFSGCRYEYSPNQCALRKGQAITLWVDTEQDANIQLDSDSPIQIQDKTSIQGGTRYRVGVAGSAQRLTVRASLANRRAQWTLRLLVPPEVPVLKKALELVGKNKTDLAIRAIEENLDQLPARQRGIALSWLARLETRNKNIEGAINRYRQAIGINQQVGCITTLSLDISALSKTYIDNGNRFDQARTLFADLDNANPHLGHSATLRVYLDYAKANLAYRTGDLRQALVLYRRAIRTASRLNNMDMWRQGNQMLALTYQLLGRQGESTQVMEKLHASNTEKLHPCDRVVLLNNVSWARLLNADAGQAYNPKTRNLVEQALRILKGSCPQNLNQKPNLLLNLASCHFHAGDLLQAEQILAQLGSKDLPLTLRLKVEKLDLRARIAIKRHKADLALKMYEKLYQTARSSWSLPEEYQAIAGQAYALSLLNRVDEARIFFQKAQQMLGSWLLNVPFGEGRSGFVSRVTKNTQRYIDWLIQRGELPQALSVVRQTRARTILFENHSLVLADLSPHDQRQRDQAIREYLQLRQKQIEQTNNEWRWPKAQYQQFQEQRDHTEKELMRLLDKAMSIGLKSRRTDVRSIQLKSPQPGELLFVFHKLGQRWLGLASDGHQVQGGYLGAFALDMAPAHLASILLSPFQKLLDNKHNKRLLVVGSGVIEQVDFHTLPYDDGILLDKLDVNYSLDLPQANDRDRPSSPQPYTATLVFDPQGDLVSTQKERKLVTHNLRQASSNWRISVLQGRQATRSALLRELPRSDLFHFSGHGAYLGLEGYQSALLLADSTRLEVGDLLLLERVPNKVVLLGCETGRSADERFFGLGLAQAFILAGSQEVIATVRPVENKAAQLLVTQLYQDKAFGPASGLALRQAQRRLHRQHSKEDWYSFRKYVP